MDLRFLVSACMACGAAPSAPAIAAAAVATRCVAPEYRQFDFWIGHWDVQENATTIAQSRVEPGQDGCTLDEHYVQFDGYRGGSISFYDAALRQWRQTWVDATGSVGEFAGRFEAGAMHFAGETHTAGGQRVLRRMTLAPVSSDRVRQTSEASTDRGQTWHPHYDYTYVRIGDAPAQP